MQDKYKEIIGNKFNELAKHQKEVNLYIYDIFTKNGLCKFWETPVDNTIMCPKFKSIEEKDE